MAKEKLSKAEAVRKAIAEGIEGNQTIADYVKEKFGLTIDTKHVANIKSGVKKKEAGAGGAAPTKATKARKNVSHVPNQQPGVSNTTLAAIRAVKEAARAVGGFANLKALAEELEQSP
jgi:hypothetical protein